MEENLLGNIGILGNGSWGTALAKILTDNGGFINWWFRKEAAAQYIKTRHHNQHYLPSVSFNPSSIAPTGNVMEVLEKSDTIIFSVPSAYTLDLLQSIPKDIWQHKKIISSIKGVIPEHNLLLNDYLSQHCDFDIKNYAAITGPCHAEEVASERLSYLTFSGLDDCLTGTVATAFGNQYIKTTVTHDIWGAQFAAVLKNIYAIGAGIAHSLDYGDNFLSVYITNCYREMHRFLEQHFAKVHPSAEHPDFLTSAYLGDLLVTCYSLHSRNRTFGAMIGKGYTVKSAMLEMNMVAEGYYASRSMQTIADEYTINIPLANAVYRILWKGEFAADVFESLEDHLS